MALIAAVTHHEQRSSYARTAPATLLGNAENPTQAGNNVAGQS